MEDKISQNDNQQERFKTKQMEQKARIAHTCGKAGKSSAYKK